ARVPWVPAIGDGACSNVGAGAVGRDVAAIFLGASGAIRVLFETDDPPVVSGGWTYHLDARRVVAGGALSNGGNVIAWLRRAFPTVDPAALWRGSLDGDGITALPLLAGDRSPTWNDAARPVRRSAVPSVRVPMPTHAWSPAWSVSESWRRRWPYSLPRASGRVCGSGRHRRRRRRGRPVLRLDVQPAGHAAPAREGGVGRYRRSAQAAPRPHPEPRRDREGLRHARVDRLPERHAGARGGRGGRRDGVAPGARAGRERPHRRAPLGIR